ncbi:GTP-binding protein LepA [Luteococcus sp. Sow4_B9]|uniref:GTP-binding protein LepA n=1 Tax=Luteococcus sp. Sow4_B9 TaxID=3438792 RepID=UPI003F9B2A54
MARQSVTEASLMEHVERLQELHPPLRPGQVDRTIKDAAAVKGRFAPTLNYLARVELEVERNLLELLTILPDAGEVDRFFYQDVWGPQELAHGEILDQLQVDLGVQPAAPMLEISFSMKMMGALSRFGDIQDVSRFIYYLTGASTERQAVLAYSAFIDGLDAMEEHAISQTIVHPIKQQEPGHFAFYRLSAQKMIQDSELRPWQLHLTRLLRSKSYALVGTNRMEKYKHQMGTVIHQLGFEDELERYAKEIGRLEAQLLWAHEQGMEYPPYFLEALRESVELYRERGSFTVEARG